MVGSAKSALIPQGQPGVKRFESSSALFRTASESVKKSVLRKKKARKEK